MNDDLKKGTEEKLRWILREFVLVIKSLDKLPTDSPQKAEKLIDVCINKITNLNSQKETKSIKELRKEFESDLCDWNSLSHFAEGVTTDKVFKWFLPHLNSRNLLERFEEGHRYTVWVGGKKLFIADDANFTLKTEGLDEFIESEQK